MSDFVELPSGKIVVMGLGRFAIGGAVCPSTGTEGVMFLPLPEAREIDADCSDLFLPLPEAREIDADCSDLFPEGEQAVDPAAVIYFTNSLAVAQTIALLMGLHARMRLAESGRGV